MRHIGKRLMSLVLVVALAFGMVYITPFASAAYVYNPQPSLWVAFAEALSSAVSGGAVTVSGLDFTFPVHGFVSDTQLDEAKDYYNSALGRFLRAQFTLKGIFGSFENCKKAYDRENGIWRLADVNTGNWIVDSMGRFPYFESVAAPFDHGAGFSIMELSPDTNPAPEVNKLDGNKWISEAQINKQLLNINPAYSYDELEAHAETLRQVEKTGRYTYAVMKHGTAGYYGLAKIEEDKAKPVIQWLADKDGHPYFTTKDKYQLAINQNVNNVIQDGNGNAVVIQGQTVTTEKPIIDQSQMEVNIPVTNDNSVSIGEYINQKIDSISYNFDDHSYTVNTYDLTYNADNRQYVTNNYTWNITYNITNTYVTYIGSNDAYQQKEYEFYYELPDGRSSADLTADEVAAMSFQFADVMNYQRSATDSNLRALYHFDGDLSDAGFFSDKTAFTWQQGASITYMDSSTFNGALYLDDTSHSFDISLSKGINATSDFSLQWRYYQASEPDTVSNIENYLSLNGSSVLRWDERKLYKGSTELCALPLGNWVEFALVKHNGSLYFYLNGVKVSTLDAPTTSLKQVSFYFGSTSRAYSMLDELRIIDFACATDGASYTPTAVPYDTNLVLTLPGEEAVVDEYWQYTSPNNLFDRPLFTNDGDYVSFTSASNVGYWGFYAGDSHDTTVSLDDSCLTISGGSSPSYGTNKVGNNTSGKGFSYKLYDGKTSGSEYAPGLSSSTGALTFSVVTTDGTVYSLSFTCRGSVATASFDWGKLCHASGYGGDSKLDYYIFVVPAAGKSISIAYMELVTGSSPQVVATKFTSIFDLSTLKPNTAAVQTDIPIHGYTVGGVRPTFPVRGDVWFGVTNGRVSTVQVYTGSAWTSSNARWWTGSRWIPIYAFDIYTLEDCWDIADSGDVITPIESDTAGWNWWKKAWTDFRSWLGGVFGGGSDPPTSSSPSPGDSGDIPDGTDDRNDIKDDTLTDEDGNEVSIFGLIGKAGKALWFLVTQLFKVVFGGVLGFFSLITDSIGGFFKVFDDGLGLSDLGGVVPWI